MLRQVKWVWKVLMTSKARRELRLAAMDEPPSFPRDSTRYVQSARKCKRIERHPTRFRSRPTGIVKRRSFSVNILPLEDRCELDVCDGWRHRTAG